jgi:hypothetical protein
MAVSLQGPHYMYLFSILLVWLVVLLDVHPVGSSAIEVLIATCGLFSVVVWYLLLTYSIPFNYHSEIWSVDASQWVAVTVSGAFFFSILISTLMCCVIGYSITWFQLSRPHDGFICSSMQQENGATHPILLNHFYDFHSQTPLYSWHLQLSIPM